MHYIEQGNNESEQEWKFRLLIDKVRKNSEYDWEEIRVALGLDCSADHLRKMAKGVELFVDEIENGFTATTLDVNSVEEVKKERMKLSDERRLRNNDLRYEARFELIHDAINKSVKELEKQKPLEWKEQNYKHSGDKEGLALFSDWHRGLFTRNYWNNFDNNEFVRRVEKLTQRVIQHGKENNIRKLHVMNLGDEIHGFLHVTSRIESTEDVITQTKSVAETLAEVLSAFCNSFEEVEVYFCRGNHSRTMQSKSDEIARESFADIIPWYLKSRLSHVKNIAFKENKYDDEIINAEICGHKVFGVHGHRDKISNVAQNLSMMTKVVPSYLFLGHYHHHEEVEVHGTEVIVNSSLSGVDSYAKEMRLTGKPAQKFMVFDKDEGRVCTYSIRLDK